MVWDTNSIIYFLENQLPDASSTNILRYLSENPPFVSVISELELLSWKRLDARARVVIVDFLSNSLLVSLSDEVKAKTIETRRAFSIKLPDAIIAATALTYQLPLLTRNLRDFEKVPGLKVLDPFDFG